MHDTLAIPNRDTEHERVLGIVFDMSPAQATILSCLVRGTIVSANELLAYSGLRPPMKVVVSRARAKVKPFGFDIQSKIGVGYWIEKHDKKGIEEAVSK